jgi:hypothetical protein
MKKVNLGKVLILSTILISTLSINPNVTLAQSDHFDFQLAGNGCNSQVEFDPVTGIVKLTPGIKLDAQNELERAVCSLRVKSPNSDRILVPLSITGSIKNRGGDMTVAITTNSGANILSTMEKTYTKSGEIDVTDLFKPSEHPQCGTSEIVGANINVFGTKASIVLDDIQFQLRSPKACF